MTPIGRNGAVDDDEPVEAVLTFHEQADGRKVARLPGGKVVLLPSADWPASMLEFIAAGPALLSRLRLHPG